MVMYFPSNEKKRERGKGNGNLRLFNLRWNKPQFVGDSNRFLNLLCTPLTSFPANRNEEKSNHYSLVLISFRETRTRLRSTKRMRVNERERERDVNSPRAPIKCFVVINEIIHCSNGFLWRGGTKSINQSQIRSNQNNWTSHNSFTDNLI
jgi:hypothetical protein